MSEVKDIKLNTLLIFILIVKLLWLISLFSHFIIKYYSPDDNYYLELNNNLEYTLHDIFTLLIGILLIYLYNHLTPKRVCIDGHTKFYLYGFGILSVIGTIQKMFHRYYFTEYQELEEEYNKLDPEL